MESYLWHTEPVCPFLIEGDLVLRTGFRVTEEAQVDDRAGVNRRGDGSVREGVAVDLRSVIVVGRIYFAR